MQFLEFNGVMESPVGDGPAAPVSYGSLVVTSEGVVVLDYGVNLSDVVGVENGLFQTSGVSSGLGMRIDVTGGDVASSSLDAARAAQGNGSQTVYLDNVAYGGNAAQVLSVTVDGTDLVLIGGQQGTSLDVYEYDAAIGLVPVFSVSDADDTYLDGIAAMARVSLGDQAFVYVGGHRDHGVTGFAIGEDGVLTEVESFGPRDGLPLSDISVMSAIQIDTEHFIIVGSAGTSSLTVLAVQLDGTLVVTDHVIDSRDTRFEAIQALEIVEADGSVFVLAAGGDMGLSLFVLTRAGRLVHLETIEDDLIRGLDRVSALAAVETDGSIDVFATAQGNLGISHFFIDLSDFGGTIHAENGVAQGSGRADVLVAGHGVDTLFGGGGDDVFVPSASDGEIDVIRDFQFGRDHIDLSGWNRLYTTDQLTAETLSGGGLRVSFGAYSTDIYLSNGQSLEVGDLDRLAIWFGQTLEITREELPVVDPDPDPDPAPDPDGGLTIYGSDGDDTLVGQSGDDEFHSGLGDDIIFTGGGADTILGSNGTDVIDYGDQAGALVVDLEDASLNAGAAGDDTLVNIEGIFGSGQADTLSGDDEDNVFRGREGNDRIDGRSGDDLLFGSDGNDALWGQDGDDTVFGGAGDDRMPGGAGDDVLYGGDGNDAIGGSYGDDHMFGGDGHDRMGAGPGHDYMEGGAGNDGLAAGADHDTLYGGDGDDRMAGSYGSDSVYGGNGNDRMGGGFGHDLIFGGDGDDVVGAGEHNDTVYGGAGDDLLNTSSGSDEIYGGAGDDQINAGWDDDSISGGTGADVFVFNDFNSGESDVVLDFELGIDQLRMNRIPGADPEAKMERLEITQFGQDTQITWKDHQITLTGILADELTADDFIFVGL